MIPKEFRESNGYIIYNPKVKGMIINYKEVNNDN